ncbi:MAG TPA: chorismate-binding protein [Thermoanaerobaculia bacterium]|nr:chorismate-binding protein [Thermoanaerobaculia bacterium]
MRRHYNHGVQRDFAFVEIAPGRLFTGWGPFERRPIRAVGRPAFFITDFFLDDPQPWWHPSRWEELSIAELLSRVDPAPSPEIIWDPVDIDRFATVFASARTAIEHHDFNKVVPVVFEHGTLSQPGSIFWRAFLQRLSAAPVPMRAYGLSHGIDGMVGATPEVLFESDRRGYRTMALAGTRPVECAGELLRDPKELREHRVVVEDIIRRLAPFGNVEIEPLSVLELPSIAHLLTLIRFEETAAEKLSPVELVRRLHPTAALGVSPRNAAGERWLREADQGVGRRMFGAPFGVVLGEAISTFLVAIRNLCWSGRSIRVGAGAGVLAESRLDREFDELRQKRDQVKALFGIESPVAVVEG